MSSTQTIERPVTTDTDQPEQFAHYAEAAKVTEAYVMGNAITALCGKVFIPSRDPEKLPVCHECKEIKELYSF